MGTRTQTGDRTSGRTMALEQGEVTVEINHRGETTVVTLTADRAYRFEIDRDVAVTDQAVPAWVDPVVRRLGLAGVRREGSSNF